MSPSGTKYGVPAVKPLLLIDVDGVLFPTGGTIPPGFEYHETDHYYAVLNPTHGEWLSELADHFEMVWATTWEHQANQVIAPLLGIKPLPVIEFSMGKGETRKLPSVIEFVERRPAAWLDDELFLDAFSWAETRPEPTLLVSPKPSVGVTRTHVDQLLKFANHDDTAEALTGL